MADDDNNISFTLDLDTEAAAKGAQDFLGLLGEIGETDSLDGILGGFAEVGIAVGAVMLAVGAFKEALDLTEEGEEIQRVQTQFMNLAQGANLSGEALQAGLEKASGGLIDTNTLLQSASRGIIEMGANSQQLVQIMELARKATMVFGGDLNQTFLQLTQAISTGNTHMLKRLGIVVDTSAAEKLYAQQNNLMVSELSEADKKQALMNASLQAAQKEFANVSVSTGRTVDSVTHFKVAITELKDVVVTSVSNVMGPAFQSFFKFLADGAKSAKDHLVAAFGKGSAQDTAKLDLLKAKAAELSQQIEDVKNHAGLLSKILPQSFNDATIEKLNQKLKETNAQIAAMTVATKKEGDTSRTVASEEHAAAEKKVGDQTKIAQNDAKFKAEMLKADEAYAKAAEKNINSIDQIEAAVEAAALQRKKAHEAAIAKIEAEYRGNSAKEQQRREALVAKENATYQAQEVQANKIATQQKEQLYTQYEQNATSRLDGIARAAAKDSNKAKADLQNFGQFGETVMSSFQSNATTAFSAMGQAIAQNQSVAKATTQAVKGLFLGMIGDVAEKQGTLLLMSSIIPPDPVGIAAGGALIAFGAALKSMSGQGGGSSPSVSTGSSISSQSTSSSTQAASNASVANSTASDQTATQAQAVTQRAVTVNIAGNYLNTAETQRSLMQLMRNETDATGFQYNSIGV